MFDAIATFIGTFLAACFLLIMLWAGYETANGIIEPGWLRSVVISTIAAFGMALAFWRARRALSAARRRADGDSVLRTFWQARRALAAEGRKAASTAARTSPREQAPASGAPGIADDVAAQMAAELQARAKKSDDAHRARIRAHVGRKAPPLNETGREAIARAQSACLAIRHVFPPRHPQRSMSFFGGVPLASDDLDWPMIHNREGLLEPLTFMGQVELKSLPEGPARSLLPARGCLYFFAPMSENFDRAADHFVVRYVAQDAGAAWGPQNNPGFLQPIDGVVNARCRHGWLNWRDQPEKFYPRSYPRIEIEFGWVADAAEIEDGEAEAGAGFPWEAAAARRRAALVAFHGAPVPYDPLLSGHDKPVDALWIPFAGFPNNRRAAEIVAGFVRTYLKEEEEALKARQAALPAPADGQGDAEKERLAAQLAQYAALRGRHAHALGLAVAGAGGPGGPGKPLGEGERTAVLALLESLRAGDLPDSVVERRYRHKRLPHVLNEWIALAAVEGAEAALADPAARAQLPDAVVEAVRYRHAVLRDPPFTREGRYHQHQMLGRGDVIQVAADTMAAGHILLLQLRPDQALDWRMGDNGALQYWIHPADLAARRFENTVLTFESH